MEGEENIMSEEHKSKAELLQELNVLRRRICELEQANQTHQNFERQFKDLFEATPVGIYRTTPDGRIIMANSSLVQMLGYSSFQELSQRDLEKEGFAPGYPRSTFKDLIKKEGEVVGLESAWIRRDGTTLFVIENARAVRDDSGKILYYEGIVQDVTERKKLEQTLIKSHEYANSLLDAAPEPIAITDLDGRIQQVNNAFERNSGRKRKELIGKTTLELGIMPEEEFQKIKSEIIPRLIKESYIRDFETIATQKDGTKAHVLISWTLLKNAEGKPIGVITVGRDITERKQTEQELQSKTNILQNIISNIPYYIFWKDKNSIYLGCNDHFARLAGIKKIEDIIGKTDYDLPWTKEESDLYRKIDKEVVSKGVPILNIEEPVHHGKGTVATILTSKVPLRNPDGEITGILGIFTDITERKKMEEALRESQRWQRAILDTIPDMAWLKDKESKYIAANEALCKAFGIKFEDFVGKTDLDISPKDLAEKYRADDQEVIKSGRRKLTEEPWGKKQGERIWIETIKSPIYNDQGQIIGTSGIARDITDRKKAEQQLQESEEKFRQVVSTTTDAIMLFDAETRQFIEVNKACEELYGYSREEFLNLKQSDITAEPKKSNESIEQTFKGKLFKIPIRYHRKKDGTMFPVEISAGTFEVKGRRVLCGVIRDITERKKAEEKIRTLISAIEQSIDGIAITDMEPKLLYVNKAFARMHDYTPEEMIGMPVARLHSKEQMEQIIGGMHQVKTRGSKEGEIENIKKDGTSFPTYMSITLLKDNDGGPSGMLAVARDITESKQREEELNDYRQKTARSERLASLGTLSAGLAHELNQPLTVITLSIENLLADMETIQHPGAVANRLHDLLNEVSKVTSITRKFRDAAKRGSERIYSQVDLKYVAEKTLKLFDERAQRSKVTLVLRGFNKLPFVHSSEEEMGQLFFALVENAIQAADGKKQRRLVISGAVKEQHIELRFSDNCGGIEPENLDRIFEPFFSTKLAGEATGLGLCIVEHVVFRAGGKVHVESKRGKGTTFYITLPVKDGARLPHKAR